MITGKVPYANLEPSNADKLKLVSAPAWDGNQYEDEHGAYYLFTPPRPTNPFFQFRAVFKDEDLGIYEDITVKMGGWDEVKINQTIELLYTFVNFAVNEINGTSLYQPRYITESKKRDG